MILILVYDVQMILGYSDDIEGNASITIIMVRRSKAINGRDDVLK